jgi:hypothetical protein
MEYTKGVWQSIITGERGETMSIMTRDAYIAEVWPNGKESMPNAHLISAAPDMYEALKRLFTQYKELGSISGMNLGVILDVELALNKAEGKA